MHFENQDQCRPFRGPRRRRLAFATSSWGLLALACSGMGHGDDEAHAEKSSALETRGRQTRAGEVIPLDKLPFVEPLLVADSFVQRLAKPTPHGENVALHVRLPPPSNPKLEGSLVRVLGEPDSPLVLFSSDALVKIGKLDKSPGSEFFTTFLQLDERELDRRLTTEKAFEAMGDPGKTTLVFAGRTPVAVTTGIAFDARRFRDGILIPLGTCPITPASTPARWEESLMITDTQVVQDPSRTNNACLRGGAPDGVWTFKHLMAEMATGSGLSTHDFVVGWLSKWLRPYVVNGDTVPARRQMFNQVILPWAHRSGVTATLSRLGVLTLGGPLNLDLAPFRLSAIVNRIDLGATSQGPSLYGGGSSSQPVDAGELRFVFGVQNLDTCSMLRFSVIFEYGVPITGCTSVRDWAKEWTKLNDAGFAGRFSAPWLAQLETMTESVVQHGAAPSKGNQNALNQIRTNEIGLASPWELREFTLGIEDPILDTNTPADGPLRAHTVAMTPDDGAFSPTPHPVVDAFVLGDVLDGVPDPLLGGCSATYTVPGQFSGGPFRGGNAFTTPPTHWEAAVDSSEERETCARHAFSLNTCNGCHFGDTDTAFLHVDPTVMPAALSNFLTGGGGVWSVPDSQFGTPSWNFADLPRRFDRLYDLACTTCGGLVGVSPGVLEHLQELNHAVPIDPIGPISRLPFEVGPVLDFKVMARLFEARDAFLSKDVVSDVELGGAVHPAQTFVH
jgi:hypothetical protein